VTFGVAVGLFALMLVAVGIEARMRGSADAHPRLSGALSVAPWVLFLAIPVWGFYRSLLARPRCLQCRSRRMTRVEDWSEEPSKTSPFELWRGYQCEACGRRTAVPAIVFGPGD